MIHGKHINMWYRQYKNLLKTGTIDRSALNLIASLIYINWYDSLHEVSWKTIKSLKKRLDVKLLMYNTAGFLPLASSIKTAFAIRNLKLYGRGLKRFIDAVKFSSALILSDDRTLDNLNKIVKDRIVGFRKLILELSRMKCIDEITAHYIIILSQSSYIGLKIEGNKKIERDIIRANMLEYPVFTDKRVLTRVGLHFIPPAVILYILNYALEPALSIYMIKNERLVKFKKMRNYTMCSTSQTDTIAAILENIGSLDLKMALSIIGDLMNVRADMINLVINNKDTDHVIEYGVERTFQTLNKLGNKMRIDIPNEYENRIIRSIEFEARLIPFVLYHYEIIRNLTLTDLLLRTVPRPRSL